MAVEQKTVRPGLFCNSNCYGKGGVEFFKFCFRENTNIVNKLGFHYAYQFITTDGAFVL